MPAQRLALLGGAYTAPSLIASAQRCLNLYPEQNPKIAQSPVDITHYDRPGLRFVSAPPIVDKGRCLYRTRVGANNADEGDLYAVLGQTVYYIDPDFRWHRAGGLISPSTRPVYISDNGTKAILVDGSPQGYSIDINTHQLTQITDPNFLGSDLTGFVDSFLVFNQPRTANWYSSLSNSIQFNALDFGTKTASADNIVAIVVAHRLIWLLGVLKSEVWFNAGTAGFPFSTSQQNMIEHGCCARYSPATSDIKLYWLSQSPEGRRIVMQGSSIQAQRISTHAIESEFAKYPRVDDAIGCCYQQSGHTFYLLHLPAADKTWAYDEATELWHERGYCDANGMLHRTRDSFCAFAYDTNLALDWSNGNLYAYDLNIFVDQVTPTDVSHTAWGPMVRLRSMPHIQTRSNAQVVYDYFMADMECGTGPGTVGFPTTASPWSSGWSSGFGPHVYVEQPLVSLRWSDTRGFTWGNKIMMPMGAAGEYVVTPTWNNLGAARDRVFEVSWSTPQKSALNGAFIAAEELEQ